MHSLVNWGDYYNTRRMTETKCKKRLCTLWSEQQKAITVNHELKKMQILGWAGKLAQKKKKETNAEMPGEKVVIKRQKL